MIHRTASGKVWLSLGMCLLVLAGLLWLNHRRARNLLQTWKARMAAQGERFGIDELAPAPARYDADFGELMAAVNRLRSRAFVPGYYLSPSFVAPGQAAAPWLATNLVSYGRGPATWAQVDREMELARDDLSAIHLALRNPADSSVLNYRNLGPSSVVAKREAAQWLAFEAIERLHRNDLPAAQGALRAVTALARLHQNDLTLHNQMIRVAIVGLAFEATAPALQLPGWTEAQLAALQSQWQQLELLKRVPPTMEMDRAITLELFERARSNGLQQVRGSAASSTLPDFKAIFEERVLGTVWRVACAEQDELFYLETTQRILEASRSGSRHQSWSRLSVDLAGTHKRFAARFDAPGAFRFSMSGMVLPNWSWALENMMRQETLRSLMLAAIALQRYQLRYGKLPHDLGSLAPEFFAAVPVDYMNGQPLHYRVEADGSFRLYSVGLDGKDDGGDPETTAAWFAYSRLFDGRDVVWPRLASEQETPVGNPEVLPLVQFADAPLPDVIRVLAKQAAVQVQIAPWAKVKLASLPPVTLRLENMTALDALETILRKNRLALVKHAGTNLVGITTR